jgi:hypothetical protein
MLILVNSQQIFYKVHMKNLLVYNIFQSLRKEFYIYIQLINSEWWVNALSRLIIEWFIQCNFSKIYEGIPIILNNFLLNKQGMPTFFLCLVCYLTMIIPNSFCLQLLKKLILMWKVILLYFIFVPIKILK